MSDKLVLPKLDLPGQKTHWSIVAVIASGVLVLVLAGVFFLVVHRQHAAREAAAREAEARAKEAAAQVEKARLEALAAAEKAKAAAAAAAAEKAKVAAPAEGAEATTAQASSPKPKKRGGSSGRSHRMEKVPPGATAKETAESTKKNEAAVDALLRGLR